MMTFVRGLGAKVVSFTNFTYHKRAIIYSFFALLLQFFIFGGMEFQGSSECPTSGYATLCHQESECYDQCYSFFAQESIDRHPGDCLNELLNVVQCDQLEMYCQQENQLWDTMCTCPELCRKFTVDKEICQSLYWNQMLCVWTMIIFNIIVLVYLYFFDIEALESVGIPQFGLSEQDKEIDDDTPQSKQGSQDVELDEFVGVDEELQKEADEEGVRMEDGAPMDSFGDFRDYQEGVEDTECLWTLQDFQFLYSGVATNVVLALLLMTGILGHPAACGGPFFTEEIDSFLNEGIVFVAIGLAAFSLITYYSVIKIVGTWAPEVNDSCGRRTLICLRRMVVIVAVVVMVFGKLWQLAVLLPIRQRIHICFLPYDPHTLLYEHDICYDYWTSELLNPNGSIVLNPKR